MKFYDKTSLAPAVRGAKARAEYDALSALSGFPSFVDAYRIELDCSYPYVVLEYVDGQHVREWLTHDEPVLEQRRRVWKQVSDAVRSAQKLANFVHDDVRSENVLVDETASVKILDPKRGCDGQKEWGKLWGLA